MSKGIEALGETLTAEQKVEVAKVIQALAPIMSLAYRALTEILTDEQMEMLHNDAK